MECLFSALRAKWMCLPCIIPTWPCESASVRHLCLLLACLFMTRLNLIGTDLVMSCDHFTGSKNGQNKANYLLQTLLLFWQFVYFYLSFWKVPLLRSTRSTPTCALYWWCWVTTAAWRSTWSTAWPLWLAFSPILLMTSSVIKWWWETTPHFKYTLLWKQKLSLLHWLKFRVLRIWFFQIRVKV